MLPVSLLEFAAAGVDCEFGWRKSEDQPTLAQFDGWKLENVAEERPVGFRIFAVKEEMYAIDHEPSVSKADILKLHA